MVLYANEMKLCPFQGIKFLFFDQFKSVPHKIYDSCCCEMQMSATSLTFWFIILNCVMQARPPRAFPLLFKRVKFNTQFVECKIAFPGVIARNYWFFFLPQGKSLSGALVDNLSSYVLLECVKTISCLLRATNVITLCTFSPQTPLSLF